VLGLSARAVGFYAAFGFPLALFCAIPYFVEPPIDADDQFARRRIRTATVLVLLAPLHVLFPLTAIGIVRDLSRQGAGPDARAMARARAYAVLGVAVSVAVFIAITRAP
jgi:hypothetical protein